MSAMLYQPTCPVCGKPAHGSSPCQYAPGWSVTPEPVATGIDPAMPGGPLDRIADALQRIAAALEAHNTGIEHD